jgi:hypothetical protein
MNGSRRPLCPQPSLSHRLDALRSPRNERARAPALAEGGAAGTGAEGASGRRSRPRGARRDPFISGLGGRVGTKQPRAFRPATFRARRRRALPSAFPPPRSRCNACLRTSVTPGSGPTNPARKQAHRSRRTVPQPSLPHRLDALRSSRNERARAPALAEGGTAGTGAEGASGRRSRPRGARRDPFISGSGGPRP